MSAIIGGCGDITVTMKQFANNVAARTTAMIIVGFFFLIDDELRIFHPRVPYPMRLYISCVKHCSTRVNSIL